MENYTLMQIRMLLIISTAISFVGCEPTGDAMESDDFDASFDSKYPSGTRCRYAHQCQDGFCERVLGYRNALVWNDYCGQCANDNDCSAGQACGLDVALEHQLANTCGRAGRHVLGERCISDSECASRVCCQGICSSCCDGIQDCPDGQLCYQADRNALEMPFQCEPKRGLIRSGDPCIFNKDCQSYECQASSTLKLCKSSGQPCKSWAECPNPRRCIRLGQMKGRCR
ncbi:MAG: hypothetical protein GY847_14055 [Proteobacteria bacterium]|nr:hypothetical protein [Pseudomonadota bacterium]